MLFYSQCLYEFWWVYRLSNGGVGGNIIENVNPIIWCLVVIEVFISIGMISWGVSMKKIIER